MTFLVFIHDYKEELDKISTTLGRFMILGQHMSQPFKLNVREHRGSYMQWKRILRWSYWKFIADVENIGKSRSSKKCKQVLNIQRNKYTNLNDFYFLIIFTLIV